MSESRMISAWKKAPISMFAATCAGIGHLPGGPGTYAAAVALPAIWLAGHHVDLWLHVTTLAVVTFVSFFWCDEAGKALGEDDSNLLVIDEFLGVWWTMVFFTGPNWIELAVGFVAFRFFDIAKPWPINRADAVIKGGFGVMLDDLLAAVWAALIVLAFRLLLP